MRTTILVALFCSGCFAISDTDRFERDESCDLQLRLRNFSPHTDDLFVVRLVQDPPDDSQPVLQAVAIFEPLESSTLNLHMPNTVAPLVTADRPHPHIDFFGDDDSMPGYQRPEDGGSDHSWRREDACVNGPDLFQHDVDFDPLPDPLVTNTGVEVALCDTPRGAPIEVRLYADLPIEGGVEERRALGLYRFTQNPRGDVTTILRFPGIVDTGFEHFIDVYVDADSNGAFDNGEQAWSFRFQAQPDAFSCDLNGALPGGVFDPCAMAPLPIAFPKFPACLDPGTRETPARVRVTLGPLANNNRLMPGERLDDFGRMPNSWLNFNADDVSD